jgi:hypothetical protein
MKTLKENMDKNMETFRRKALSGKVDGKDVAELFGFGELYENSILESEDNDTSDNSDEENSEDESADVEFTAESFEDFLNKTNSKVSITKVSTEPSPIFGPHDRKNHNKYKVTVSNENGSIWFYYWDSIHNTENGIEPSKEDVLSAFGLDTSAMIDGASFEDFCDTFGYDKAEDRFARKAYDGCRLMVQKAKKLFSDDEIKEFIRLANEH